MSKFYILFTLWENEEIKSKKFLFNWLVELKGEKNNT